VRPCCLAFRYRAGVTVTAVAPAPGADLPGTELFASSDGSLVYQTGENGRLQPTWLGAGGDDQGPEGELALAPEADAAELLEGVAG
jgi:hypothetical protein